MTKKYDHFKEELIALCEKHNVQLSAGYEPIEVSDADSSDQLLSFAIYGDFIIDRTSQG